MADQGLRVAASNFQPSLFMGDMATHYGEWVDVTVKRRNVDLKNAAATIARYGREYCSTVSGQWVSGSRVGSSNWGACESNSRDLFAISIFLMFEPKSKEHVFSIGIAESKPSQWASAPYRAAVNELGRFSVEEKGRTEALQATDRDGLARQKIAQQRAAAAEQAAAVVAERPRKILVGAKVCRGDGPITWVGFTERYSAETQKIKIRVAGTSRAYQLPAGWTPQIIWDNPDGWMLCE